MNDFKLICSVGTNKQAFSRLPIRNYKIVKM